MSATTYTVGTDMGPACPVCDGTIYGYRVTHEFDENGDGDPRVSFVPKCNGCGAVGDEVSLGTLPEKAREMLTASTFRKAHENARIKLSATAG